MSAKTTYEGTKKDEIISLYEGGYALSRIAKRLGVTNNPLLRLLREWGVYRPQGKVDESKVRVDAETEATIIQLFNRGFKSATIEKMIGVRKKAVIVILARNGLKRKVSKTLQRRYSKRHREKLKAQGRKPYCDPVKKRIRARQYKIDNRERLRVQARKRYDERRPEINRLQRERRRNNRAFNTVTNLRNRIYRLVKRGDKAASTMELIGCSKEFLKEHFESQFKTVQLDYGTQFTMTWDNYGLRGWHIDHIKPCTSFDLTDPEQQKACFHWSNLRPLYSTHNISRRFNPFFQQAK